LPRPLRHPSVRSGAYGYARDSRYRLGLQCTPCVYGMGGSTKCMRHVHRQSAPCTQYMHTNMHVQDHSQALPEYSQGTPRGPASASALCVVLTAYSHMQGHVCILNVHTLRMGVLQRRRTPRESHDSTRAGLKGTRVVLPSYSQGHWGGHSTTTRWVLAHARVRVQPSTFSARPTPMPARRGTPRSSML
jgi:hypothetical protein